MWYDGINIKPHRYVREDMPCYPIEERCLHNVPEDTYFARSYLHCSANLEEFFGPPYIWTRKYCPQNLKFSFKAQLCLPNWNYIKTEFGEWIMDKNNLPKYS
uniref:Uncharacterized protein n=1 Tax=Acrobeloides nanus TaxID=290746 RepID=A0A914DP97_9BILA